MKNTKSKKQSELIKSLFEQMVIDFDIDQSIPLKLRISKKWNASSFIIGSRRGGVLIRQSITYNLCSSIGRCKEGYSSDYYNGRSFKLDPFIKGNKHFVIRFILLHEIGHCIYHRRYIYFKSTANTETKERFADDFALTNIRRYL